MSTSQNGSETPDSENLTLQHDELPSKRIRRSSSQSDSTESDSDDSIIEAKSPKTAANDMMNAIGDFWYAYTNSIFDPNKQSTRAESLELMNRFAEYGLMQLKMTKRLIEEEIKEFEDKQAALRTQASSDNNLVLPVNEQRGKDVHKKSK